MIYTATVWQKDDMDPCTVAFSSKEKAEAYKKKMEKLFKAAGNTYFRVTIDSSELNDGTYYLNSFAAELGVELPEEQKKAMDGIAELEVTFAVDGRYRTIVRVPKESIPAPNAPQAEIDNFAKAVTGTAEFDYYNADFGELEDIDGHSTIIEDEGGEIIWDRA